MRPNWFVGLPLDDGWVPRAITGIPPGLRTFDGEDLHVTVAFLGDVDADAAYRAWRTVIEHDDGTPRDLGPAFDLTLGGVLPFGPPAQPSALSVVPAEGDSACLDFIAAHRDRALRAAGCPSDRWPIRPHATIARIGRKATDEARAEALAWAAGVPPLGVTVQVSEVALYTWTDDRRKQLFRIVERRGLG